MLFLLLFSLHSLGDLCFTPLMRFMFLDRRSRALVRLLDDLSLPLKESKEPSRGIVASAPSPNCFPCGFKKGAAAFAVVPT